MSREWLVTNGTGGYASGTISGANTRCYHGLLVAALAPPLGRTVLVAKVDEEIVVEGKTWRLGTNEYESRTIDPDGYLYLKRVILWEQIPALIYGAGGFQLTKTIWMEQGKETTYVRYELSAESAAAELTLLPFCTYRDFHGETHGPGDLRLKVEPQEGGFRFWGKEDARPYWVRLDRGGSFVPLHLWYWRFFHRVEAERGLEASEDLYLPGLLRASLAPGDTVTLIVTAEPQGGGAIDCEAAWGRATARALAVQQGSRDDFERQLCLAADQFIVTRLWKSEAARTGEPRNLQEHPTVIAGYHWFGDWGRDTMISLEGLTLARGLPEVARQILMAFSEYISEGMLPNRFPDSGEAPEYNTVDATLWYFHAIARYWQATGDETFLRELFPKLAEIVDWHVRGTRFQIKVDAEDGLLRAGEPGWALTWMDARIDNWAATPRIGKPVEINALWYDALCWMGKWAGQLGEASERFERLAGKVRISFERFWSSEQGHLCDVLDTPEGNDGALRPNQLIALSLDHTAVPVERARAILAAVERDLLTPYGLRTLSPHDPHFVGSYRGDRRTRDAAYHQGTVWPWLLGPYVEAKLKFDARGTNWESFFDPLRRHLAEAGLGSISEIFEPHEPYRPVGCIAQAWSTAEVLRVYRLAAARQI